MAEIFNFEEFKKRALIKKEEREAEYLNNEKALQSSQEKDHFEVLRGIEKDAQEITPMALLSVGSIDSLSLASLEDFLREEFINYTVENNNERYTFILTDISKNDLVKLDGFLKLKNIYFSIEKM